VSPPGPSGRPGPPNGDLELTDDVPGAFAEAVRQAFAERPGERFVLVLSGGPTARRCYERLAAESAGRVGATGGAEAGSAIDWRLVDVCMGDERCVPPDDEDANQRLVGEALLDRVGPVGSFRPMSCEEGPDAYAASMASLPEPDVVHLGLGTDAHTASLFPGSDALEAPGDKLVVTSRDPNGRNAHDRMTLTLRAIARARLVLFTVVGEEKVDALRAVCDGADVPAARVRAQRVRWLVDRTTLGDACD
jgi:6-phosphogluconolactonase